MLWPITLQVESTICHMPSRNWMNRGKFNASSALSTNSIVLWVCLCQFIIMFNIIFSQLDVLFVFTDDELEAPTVCEQIDLEIVQWRSLTFADSTKHAYKTHKNTYQNVCKLIKCGCLPIMKQSYSDMWLIWAEQNHFPPFSST